MTYADWLEFESFRRRTTFLDYKSTDKLGYGLTLEHAENNCSHAPLARWQSPVRLRQRQALPLKIICRMPTNRTTSDFSRSKQRDSGNTRPKCFVIANVLSPSNTYLPVGTC